MKRVQYRWYDVNKKQPDRRERVLVLRDGHGHDGIFVGKFKGRGGYGDPGDWNFETDHEIAYGQFHWAPIPKWVKR